MPPPMMAASPVPTSRSVSDAAGVTLLSHQQDGLNYQPSPKQEDSFDTDHAPPPMMAASPVPTNQSLSGAGVVMTMLDGHQQREEGQVPLTPLPQASEGGDSFDSDSL